MPTAAHSTTADAFILSLEAGMAGLPEDAYVARQEERLRVIDRVPSTPAPLKTSADWERAWAVKGAMASLWCYLVNRNDDRADQVGALESAWARALYRYTRRFLARTAEARTVARYLASGRVLTVRGAEFPVQAELALGAHHGVLRRRPDSQTAPEGPYAIVVVGLRAKAGDNVFTVDRRGREHRQYLRVCVPQCFSVSRRAAEWLRSVEGHAFAATLPALEPEYVRESLTGFGDHKHHARPIAFRPGELPRLVAALAPAA